jgi:hypothetical protein
LPHSIPGPHQWHNAFGQLHWGFCLSGTLPIKQRLGKRELREFGEGVGLCLKQCKFCRN